MHRVVTGFNAGFVTVNEARQANQLPPLDNGDYFVRNMTIAEVPVDGTDITMYHNGETEYAADESTIEEKAEEVETKVDKVPSYIQKNAQRGLDLLEFAGSGLTDKTKREARELWLMERLVIIKL